MKMVLWHGTNEEHLESILERGLLPGDAAGQSNWDKYPARPGMVYLSDGLAWRFAVHTLLQETAGEYSPLYHPVIVEVNVGAEHLLPDEDCLGQIMAIQRGEPLRGASAAVTVQMMRENRDLWRYSLGQTGTVAHEGPIPPRQIRRVMIMLPALWRIVFELLVAGIHIPQVGTYATVSDEARRINRFAMGDLRQCSDVTYRRDNNGRGLSAAVNLPIAPPRSRRMITLNHGRVVDDRVV